jgi:hypothetical protein
MDLDLTLEINGRYAKLFAQWCVLPAPHPPHLRLGVQLFRRRGWSDSAGSAAAAAAAVAVNWTCGEC